LEAPNTTAVDRLLRHAARQSIEVLESVRAPVEAARVAERIVYAHHHLMAVRARRLELIAQIAGYVRELRARRE
jgi:hypothetical protein